MGARMVLNARYFHIARTGERLGKYSFSPESAAALVQYIATRETVIWNPTPEYEMIPATPKQKAAIEQFKAASPDVVKSREYQAYLKCQTAANATRFINRATDYTFGLRPNGANAGDTRPATRAQRERISEFVQRVPEIATTPEFKDYASSPTIENASEVLSHALEVAMESAADPDTIKIMLNYIAERPGVEKDGQLHGLFSVQEHTDLEQAKEDFSKHTGNIYSFVFSLRREDADRLGFNTQSAWREVVMDSQEDISVHSGIPINDLHWVAAVHNTKHHPHMHFMFYSENPTSKNFVTKHSLEKIKQSFVSQIFSEDLLHIYEPKATLEQQIKDEMEILSKAAQQISASEVAASSLPSQLLALRSSIEQLPGGRKVYKYLPPEIKQQVDAILSEIERFPKMEALLSQYGELQNQLYQFYNNSSKPDKTLLSTATRQSGLYFAKNAVIRSALEMKLPQQTTEFFPEAEFVSQDSNKPIEGSMKSYSSEVLIPIHPLPDISFENPSDSTAFEALTSDRQIQDIPEKPKAAMRPEQIQSLHDQARNGHTDSQFRYARYCQYDLGDIASAVTWYGIAADQGNHAEAAYKLAQIYLHGAPDFQDIPLGNEYLLQAKLGMQTALLESNNNALIDLIDQGVSFEDAIQQWPYIEETEHTYSSLQSGQRRAFQFARYEYLLGRIYLSGIEIESIKGIELKDLSRLQVPTDPHKALAYLKLAYRSGENRLSPYYIGKLYYRGDITGEPDYEQAAAWYHRGEKDSVFCRYALGRMYERGIGVSIDMASAATYYRTCLNNEIVGANAAYALASLQHSGKCPGTPEETQALFQLAADAWNALESPDAYTALRLASLYERGLGVIQDYGRASQLYRSCLADSEYGASAAYSLAEMIRTEKISAKPEEMHRLYRQAAETWQQKEQPGTFINMRLARMYQDGLGVEQSFERAAHFYRACLSDPDQGASAAYSIAEMIRTGKISAKQEEIHRLYRQAAETWQQLEKPDVFVTQRLARMHEYGLGVPVDHMQAFKLYRTIASIENPYAAYRAAACLIRSGAAGQSHSYYRMALQGYLKLEKLHPDAQRELLIGTMFQYGKGTARNTEQSAVWYWTAMQNGAENAQEYLFRLQAQIQNQQIAVANAAVKLLSSIAMTVNSNAQNQIQSHRPARSLTQRLQNRMRQKLGQKHDYEQTFQNTP